MLIPHFSCEAFALHTSKQQTTSLLGGGLFLTKYTSRRWCPQCMIPLLFHRNGQSLSKLLKPPERRANLFLFCLLIQGERVFSVPVMFCYKLQHIRKSPSIMHCWVWEVWDRVAYPCLASSNTLRVNLTSMNYVFSVMPFLGSISTEGKRDTLLKNFYALVQDVWYCVQDWL